MDNRFQSKTVPFSTMNNFKILNTNSSSPIWKTIQSKDTISYLIPNYMKLILVTILSSISIIFYDYARDESNIYLYLLFRSITFFGIAISIISGYKLFNLSQNHLIPKHKKIHYQNPTKIYFDHAPMYNFQKSLSAPPILDICHINKSYDLSPVITLNNNNEHKPFSLTPSTPKTSAIKLNTRITPFSNYNNKFHEPSPSPFISPILYNNNHNNNNHMNRCISPQITEDQLNINTFNDNLNNAFHPISSPHELSFDSSDDEILNEMNYTSNKPQLIPQPSLMHYNVNIPPIQQNISYNNNNNNPLLPVSRIDYLLKKRRNKNRVISLKKISNKRIKKRPKQKRKNKVFSKLVCDRNINRNKHRRRTRIELANKTRLKIGRFYLKNKKKNKLFSAKKCKTYFRDQHNINCGGIENIWNWKNGIKNIENNIKIFGENKIRNRYKKSMNKRKCYQTK